MEQNNTNNTNNTPTYTPSYNPNPEKKSHAGLIGIIIALLLIVIGAGSYLYYHKAIAPVEPVDEEIAEAQLASECGLTVETPVTNASVSFPVTITGTINNTEGAACAWTMFEGQAGVAELYYETKDGWSLPVDTAPIEVADWMTTSTTFSATLEFDNTTEQFPAGYNFKIVLVEEDPSGMGKSDRLEIPVVLE
jgi:hypothetical protein